MIVIQTTNLTWDIYDDDYNQKGLIVSDLETVWVAMSGTTIIATCNSLEEAKESYVLMNYL